MAERAGERMLRFFAFVRLRKGPLSTKCWYWTGNKDKYWSEGKRRLGYGRFYYNRRLGRAYRYAYETFVGAVPVGKELDHLCRVRPCVRPSHLEPVTRLVNILRGCSLSAINSRKTACPKGHPLDGRSNGPGRKYRYCRECARIWHRQYYHTVVKERRAKLCA